MTDIRKRYPGAQPFPDNDFSRRTFFGRERAAVALTDQILASRLVVVYAKSGLGKTSLVGIPFTQLTPTACVAGLVRLTIAS